MAKHPRPEDGTDRNEEFLQRWSRRKAAATENVVETETAAEKEPLASAVVPEPSPKTDTDMPPVETIDESTDMRDFFSPEVSEQLRRVALRKLFHLPQFNIVDGLDDYDEDFTTFEALGEIVTADMRHQMELEQEQLASSEAEEVAEEGLDESDVLTPADEPREDAAQGPHADPADEGEMDEQTADAHDESIENGDDHRDS